MLSDLKPLITPNDLAEITGLNANVVRKLCDQGEIPARKIGAKWFIPRDLLLGEFIELEKRCKTRKIPASCCSNSGAITKDELIIAHGSGV